MYPNLNNIGVLNHDDIERYTLRQEAGNDILKIYFRKGSRDFFAKSVKFKFPRQLKKVSGDHDSPGFRNISEINSTLRPIIKELDILTVHVKHEKEIKLQVLDDLKHLESVVTSKIKEIERKLEKL
ncbi:DUF3461 family protein [Psychromonas ossibalaenae]|uniref:DUF3461 family protein n=1 Tax=Psychromonas ossibalaenae TaxID=444922 RepID=UPI000360B0E6|nr:DUF3461 family protein [Psychromonas ossibalaenae]